MEPRRIAISQRVMTDPRHGEVRDCLDQEWTIWLASLGIIAAPVPNRVSNISDFCSTFDVSAIFLSGGNNLYGPVYEDTGLAVSDTSAARDETEFALIDFAVERKIPLFAWCRGLQVLQVYFGGKLVSTAGSDVDHVGTTHDVRFTSQRYMKLAGTSVLRVNSFHDFGIRRSALASPLSEMAISNDDGLVEALYHPRLPIVGCQWHPERPNGGDAFCRALVDAHFSPEGTK